MQGINKRVVKFNGGLGNQMFQYAFASVLAKKFGVEVVFDFSFFEDVKDCEIATSRVFELGVFNVDCKEATKEDLAQVVHPQHCSKFQNRLWKLFKIKKFRPVGNSFLQTKSYAFDKDLLNDPNYFYYNGYFQNEKYFKHLRTELLKSFSLKEPLDEKNQSVLNIIKSTNSVSLHIRRGDYVSLECANKFHGVCSLDYYKKAIEYIAKKVKNPNFFLFSDDIAWVVENLKINYPYTVIDFNQGKGHLDLELMKNCNYNIIANSSFSWWGAWLNENPEKIVIAPQKWTAQKVKKCDVIPNKWVKL